MSHRRRTSRAFVLAILSNVLMIHTDGFGQDIELKAPLEADAVVFFLDYSLSMRTRGRFEIQKRIVTNAISELRSKSEFGVVIFGTSAVFHEQLIKSTEANKEDAVRFLSSLSLALTLDCLGPGVIKALEMTQKANSKNRAVVFIGDGRALICQQLLQDTVAANPGMQAKVHTIVVGRLITPSTSIDFMRNLAELHNGTFKAVGGNFVRGDANGAAGVDIADVITIVQNIVPGLDNAPVVSCEAVMDVDNDNAVNFSDVVALLDYLFDSGPEPAAPFPFCGIGEVDPAQDCNRPFNECVFFG